MATKGRSAPKPGTEKRRPRRIGDGPYSPELFRYEAFNGDEAGGLATVLHALEKLSRLSALAQRGRGADADVLVGDAELLDELAEAVGCAAMHARAMHEKAVA